VAVEATNLWDREAMAGGIHVASLGNLWLLIFANSKLLLIIWRRDERSCNLRVSMNAKANKQAKHQEPTHHHQARNNLLKAIT
jgi:hypothetical protein